MKGRPFATIFFGLNDLCWMPKGNRFIICGCSANTFVQRQLIGSVLSTMKLLNTYEDKDDAETAAAKLQGEKRLASERDSTEVIYNLFGLPTWGNFHRLGMYNLGELGKLLARRDQWGTEEQTRHREILNTLQVVSKNFEVAIPSHWF